MHADNGGAALPAALLLITATSLTAIAAVHAARTESRLGATVRAAATAFDLAEHGIANGLAYARSNPAQLPDNAPLALPAHTVDAAGSVMVTLLPGPLDSYCPELAPLPATRRHFEIRATGVASGAVTTTHVQGFYVCTASCMAPDCIAIETLPVRSYWQQRMGRAQ